VARAERFENERIVLGHLSLRHSRDEVLSTLKKRLPASLVERLVVWL
jgi:ribonuclease Z